VVVVGEVGSMVGLCGDGKGDAGGMVGLWSRVKGWRRAMRMAWSVSAAVERAS